MSTPRLKISANGIVMSRPGEDVNDPLSAKLMDPAYTMLALHQQGVSGLGLYNTEYEGQVYYWRVTISFPPLASIPIVNVNVRLSTTFQEISYPGTMTPQVHIQYNDPVQGTRIRSYQNNFRVTNSSLTVDVYTKNDVPSNPVLFYQILKNART